MTEDIQPSEFVDQIIEHTLQALSNDPAFDDEVLRRLKALAEASGLIDHQQVVEALSKKHGE